MENLLEFAGKIIINIQVGWKNRQRFRNHRFTVFRGNRSQEWITNCTLVFLPLYVRNTPEDDVNFKKLAGDKQVSNKCLFHPRHLLFLFLKNQNSPLN